MTQVPALTDVARALLRRALQGDVVAADEPGFDDVDRLGVLVSDPYRRGVYAMAAPSQIEDRLYAAAARQVTEAAVFISGIRAFLDDLAHERAQFGGQIPPPHNSSYFICGVDAARETMNSLIYAAKSELRAVQPGKRERKILDAALPRDVALMERGVPMRTLYQHVNRPLRHVRRYVAAMTAAGARFRLTDAPLVKMVMIDRAHAFIPDITGGRDHTAGAWHIRDPAAIAYMAQLFELEWLRSTPWDFTEVPDDTRPEVITTARQRSILRGICSGQSYEQIGRSLSIKVRTVADNMARLRKVLKVDTNEELAYWFATAADRLVRDAPAGPDPAHDNGPGPAPQGG
ncbi:LuxR C-terminal-related transcriptional regulator [Streptomyces lasiicapitis]|uniref:helix-turn-helix transcriptional regulator n=1 Tax=Streptomyces lasiicapitis TaxID=1923961 RepID=UPI00332AE316